MKNPGNYEALESVLESDAHYANLALAMRYRRTFEIASVLLMLLGLGTGIDACAAFSDAASYDGGQAGSSTKLIFDKTPYILQGQRKDFSISFATPPVWSGTDAGRGFLTAFKFFDADNPDTVLSDIQFIAEYDGNETITATVQASPDADTQIKRILEIDVAYEKIGQHQLHYKGTGNFWVLPKTGSQSLDGNDHADGMDGGTE